MGFERFDGTIGSGVLQALQAWFDAVIGGIIRGSSGGICGQGQGVLVLSEQGAALGQDGRGHLGGAVDLVHAALGMGSGGSEGRGELLGARADLGRACGVCGLGVGGWAILLRAISGQGALRVLHAALAGLVLIVVLAALGDGIIAGPSLECWSRWAWSAVSLTVRLVFGGIPGPAQWSVWASVDAGLVGVLGMQVLAALGLWSLGQHFIGSLAVFGRLADLGVLFVGLALCMPVGGLGAKVAVLSLL